ncbi:MAG: nitrile hydratase accessory protein [Dongiaceae bacterium]
MTDAADREPAQFAEPWQAQAFATVVALSRAGHFGWNEWVAALGAEIARAPQAPGESSEAAYYRQWLAALEHLLVARGLVPGAAAIDATAELWRRSYLATPHGEAVTLRRDLPEVPDAHDHGQHRHHARPAPVAVEPASTSAPNRC